MIDNSEKILQIWVYESKLRNMKQMIQIIFNYQFVVPETTKWWWSIEKDDARIVIQRSEQLNNVRDSVDTIEDGKHLQRERRTPVCQLSYDEGRKSIKDLIDFLYDRDELNIEYDLLEDNCKDFAKKVFDEFAKQIFIILYLVVFLQVAKKAAQALFMHSSLVIMMILLKKSRVTEMSDAKEMILQILVYKCPLSSWQLTSQLFFNHHV